MERTKPVHQLDTPFSSVEWPKTSQEDQEAMLDLLCNLLSPIGQHRKAYIHQSKGKRSNAKRKRDQHDEPQQDRPVPPLPAAAASVEVGLSNITRNLQLDTSTSDPELMNGNDSSLPSPYAAIFVARSGPPSAFFSHLPRMVAVASKSQQLSEPIRLVGFSKACEERLSACMGIPRVTSVALRANDLAQSKALVSFVRDRVPVIEVPWLEQVGKGEYHETKINTIQAPVGQKRQRKA